MYDCICKNTANLACRALKCPDCGSRNIGTSAKQCEAGDLEMVECDDCKWETDEYEAWKCFHRNMEE